MSEAVEFPQTLIEAVAYFADRDRALRFFVEMRWPNGIICPHCGVKDDVSFISTRRIWKCKGCRQQFSAKVGTIFEDSPLGLDKWMACIWIVVNAKNAVSSYEIHRALGVRQPTAWFMLQRIRYALESQNFEKLTGTVEADETFVGGKEKNKHKSKKLNAGRGTVGKAVVMGLLVLQPHLGAEGGPTAAVVAALRPALVSPSPAGPREHPVLTGRARPEQPTQQAAHLRHR